MTGLRELDWERALRDAPSGFAVDDHDRDAVERAAGPGAATYGELLPHAARRLLGWMRLGPGDVLFDLGSGAGRLVVQAVCETDVGRAIGVELSRARHAAACEGARRLSAALDTAGRTELSARLELRCEDARVTALADATHVYLAATSFPKALLHAVCRRLRDDAPDLRVLVSTRALPDTWSRDFPPIGELDLDMTWAEDIRCFVHGRRPTGGAV